MFICEFANGRYLAMIRSPHVILLQTQHYLAAIDEFHHAMNLPGVHITEREDGALPAVDIALGPPGGGHTHTGGHGTHSEEALVSQVSLQRVPHSALTVSVVSSAALCTLMITLADRGVWPAQAKQALEKGPFDHLDLTQAAAEESPRV